MELLFIKMGKTEEKHITGGKSRVWFGDCGLKGKAYGREMVSKFKEVVTVWIMNGLKG